MMIKLFLGGDIYKNNVTPGVYPKWSKMHLRIWCIGRMENMIVFIIGHSPKREKSCECPHWGYLVSVRCAQTNGRIVDDKRDSRLIYVNETSTPARIASQSLARTLKRDPNGFPRSPQRPCLHYLFISSLIPSRLETPSHCLAHLLELFVC